tara:strand:+ start:2989 stop:3945 length:957 start_codon:yes stop_codon:yes gene_type:complete
MDKYFQNLDETLCELKTEDTQSIPEKSCCDNIKNHRVFQGMTTCSICNDIITNIIENPEWRYYGSQDTKSSDPTRCGMPVNLLLPESSIGTSISYRGTRTHKMNKLRKYQQWNGMPYKERSLLKVFNEINDVCRKVDLPIIIINEANSLYKIVSTTKISRGANRKGIIAACVYFSCKINKAPRSTNEIAEVFNIAIPVMSKGCKKFQEIMQLNKVDIKRIHSSETINIDDFIERFCDKLDLNIDDIKMIQEISRLAQIYNLVNENTPPSMAAGCIYLYICDNNISIDKELIANVCKISEVTVNKCYKKLEGHKNKLII